MLLQSLLWLSYPAFLPRRPTDPEIFWFSRKLYNSNPFSNSFMQSEASRANRYSSTDGSLVNSSEIAQHGNGIRLDGSVVDVSGEDAGDPAAVGSDGRGNPGANSILEKDCPQLPQVSNWTEAQFEPSLDFRSQKTTARGRKQSLEVPTLQTRPRVSLDDLPNGRSRGFLYEESLLSMSAEVLTHILSHLTPSSLNAVASVSRRFHSLVTTPHAWRIAFSRYFPAHHSLESHNINGTDVVSDRRAFARLTAHATWRNEYILRTRLLRSLSRGKPAQHPSRGSGSQSGSAVVTYPSQLLSAVTHLHAVFPSSKPPQFIHGAAGSGIVSSSDPSQAKANPWTSRWGNFLFQSFTDLFPGDSPYGLGAGEIVGMPNSMDVSQPYGMVYGEGCPQGRLYFISAEERRGRFLSMSELGSHPSEGIPALHMATTSVTAVWIAKTSNVPKMTRGLIGILSGLSSGVVTAYSLGPRSVHDFRVERGQMTARWVLCPGVPIIAIAVDENFSEKRHAQRRIWVTVLNALGEVFYLTDIPTQRDVPSKNLSPQEIERIAWRTGRSVHWEMIEATRRIAHPDPFNRLSVDASYSPRSSSDSMALNEDQVAAETREIEQFLSFKPKHFRKVCDGWDMRRQLKVDFAGDDSNGAGESAVIINCGLDEGQNASIRRFMRVTVQEKPAPRLPRSGSSTPTAGFVAPHGHTEWRVTDFVFDGPKSHQLTAAAIDESIYAQLTIAEDPLLSPDGAVTAESSPRLSPMPHAKRPASVSEIPGQRARHLAVGTGTGLIYVWDIRATPSLAAEIVNSVRPLRVIRTESPKVLCLAVSSLYLVHGGDDNLVQAWDVLASTTQPIRTLHSRSSRARRRLVQAEASLVGIGTNNFVPSAICLDPDPTVLRGVVVLGTHIRYWSYSSSGADEYKRNKRRLRRSPRDSNGHEGQRSNYTGRETLRDFIEDEHREMKRQEIEDQKMDEWLRSRFGVDLFGPDATEEELIAYAQMLSEEAYNNRQAIRTETRNATPATTGSSDRAFSSDVRTPVETSPSSLASETVEEEMDPDLAEAIRLSLEEQKNGHHDFIPTMEDSIPIRYSKSRKSSRYSSPSLVPDSGESSNQRELEDLEFAIQLSLAEEQSRHDTGGNHEEQFPVLESPQNANDKGKGKARVP